MHKICARLYFFVQCAIYVQDCTYFLTAQHLHKIVLISSMHNICARFAQDCTSFSNAQYVQDCTSFPDAQYMCKILTQCAIYVQDLHNIVRLSPMRNICARFVQDYTSFSNAQDCTYFPNAQYMRKIVLISSMSNICTKFMCTSFSNAQDMCNICARFAQD